MTTYLPNKGLLSTGHMQALLQQHTGPCPEVSLYSIYILRVQLTAKSGEKDKVGREVGKGRGPPFLQGAHISSEMPFGESEEGIMGTWGGG